MRGARKEEKYREMIRHEQKTLEDFAKSEIEWAEEYLQWNRIRKRDPPADEYTAAVYFTNREFLRKPGSLTLLLTLDKKLRREGPEVTRENAFEVLCFRFRMYGAALREGGY
jgi:hypothetical protein